MTPNTALLMRKPKRVSITVSHIVIERLQRLSDEQGRSTSNLAAHLLEVALDAMEGAPPIPKRWPNKAA
jgi:predicted DNA-binding protein